MICKCSQKYKNTKKYRANERNRDFHLTSLFVDLLKNYHKNSNHFVYKYVQSCAQTLAA